MLNKERNILKIVSKNNNKLWLRFYKRYVFCDEGYLELVFNKH